MNNQVNAMFKTILFPVDLSRESLEAAEMVSQLIKLHNSRLYLLSVVEGDGQDMMSSEASVAQLLEEAKTMFAKQGIPSETIERTGKPAFIICDVADEINAELIVMGSRGLGLTLEGAQDSVANRVISLAPCPVLVVP
jgi:nucleotide-binding universal stress UspA family protein